MEDRACELTMVTRNSQAQMQLVARGINGAARGNKPHLDIEGSPMQLDEESREAPLSRYLMLA